MVTQNKKKKKQCKGNKQIKVVISQFHISIIQGGLQ